MAKVRGACVLLVIVSCGLVIFAQNRSQTWASSGIPDIDQIRRQIVGSPTTSQNARERLAMLNSWFRLLMHQGFDMSSFRSVRDKLGHGTPRTDATFRAIDEGYAVLDQVQANPVRIEPKVGKRSGSEALRPTDWPLFHGNNAQTGYTDDPGPARGELAWRFPIGHSWYATPTIENGRVYIASPGMTTLMYALDEATGQVVWKTRQYGLTLYGAPRACSGIVSLGDKLVVRASSGSWEDEQPVQYLFYVDKRMGKVVKQADAGLVDYRRGYAPVQGNDEYLVFPVSRMDIRNMPAAVWMLDTVAVKKAATGEVWWTFRVGDIFGEPVVAGDQVYVGTDSGQLYSLNLPGSQRIRWQVQLNAPLRSTPAVAGDNLYIGANDGTFYAFDKANGKTRWTFKAQEPESRAFQFFSRPTIAGGRVYVGAANGFIYALDARSGQLLWKYHLNDWVRSRPVVIAQAVYVATIDGTVWALENSASGTKVLWQRKVAEHQILADLVGNGNGLLVNDSGLWLHSLNPNDGRLRWRQKLLESAYINGELFTADRIAAGSDYQSPPIVVNGTVFVGGPDRFVHAVDVRTGKEIWRFETSGQVSAAPIVANGRVYFGQQGGNREFYCVSQKDGHLLWKRLLGWAWVSASYSDGKIFVGTVEGDIFSLDAGSGRILWIHPTNGGVYPAPAIDEQNVYTGSWDGYYYALDKNAGQAKWAYATPGWDYARGGGPDSAAPILWKGNVLARVFPATLAAIDKKTGKVVWEFRAPAREIMNATAAAHDGRVYVPVVAYLDGAPMGATLFALDDTTGNVLWQYRGAGGWPGASLTGDRVCVGSSTHPFFVCLDPKGNGDGTTSVLWRYRVGGIFEESVPAIYGDMAFVLCTDNYLYAFR